MNKLFVCQRSLLRANKICLSLNNKYSNELPIIIEPWEGGNYF